MKTLLLFGAIALSINTFGQSYNYSIGKTTAIIEYDEGMEEYIMTLGNLSNEGCACGDLEIIMSDEGVYDETGAIGWSGYEEDFHVGAVILDGKIISAEITVYQAGCCVPEEGKLKLMP